MTTLRTHSLFTSLSTRSQKTGTVKKLTISKIAGIVFVFCLATAMVSPAQTFTTLVSFDGTNGSGPYLSSPVQGVDGNIYGTAGVGGVSDYCTEWGTCGTVYKITPAGALTTVYNFCSENECVDGALPYNSMILGTNGDFYGLTTYNGPHGAGEVFKVTPAGALTVLYPFCTLAQCTDGDGPISSWLVEATDGDFYGTTDGGGAYGYGIVFRLTPAGTLTTLYSFCSQKDYTCPDGSYPWSGLVQATNGDFYGTTRNGGAQNAGTVFKITPAGVLTTLHTFCSLAGCADGDTPQAGLILGSDGNLYGTTSSGGANYQTCWIDETPCGTIFKITPAGVLTTLYTFCSLNNCADGYYPYAGLVQGTDGRFYGTVEAGGAYGYGTVFAFNENSGGTGGTLTTLYSFCTEGYPCADGARPEGGLVQSTNGTFYGTTYEGGTSTIGTVFSVSVGLAPFVETLPTSGKVGAAVIILGNNLTGTTAVSFNGTSAKFTVVSETEIKTTVPTGATTGKIEVATPTGTLTSNAVFRVTS